jgi:hypothetical protein
VDPAANVTIAGGLTVHDLTLAQRGISTSSDLAVVVQSQCASSALDEYAGYNSSGTQNFTVDCNGNVGSIVKARNNMYATATMARSTLPVLEDYGEAQLLDGVATVRLDPAFAQTISDKSSYLVFLTPDGDTNGLYVASKTIQSFQVREVHGGRSSVSFDYRIVARTANDARPRMALSIHAPMNIENPKHKPRLNLHS